jgi:hypothetical protein
MLAVKPALKVAMSVLSAVVDPGTPGVQLPAGDQLVDTATFQDPLAACAPMALNANARANSPVFKRSKQADVFLMSGDVGRRFKDMFFIFFGFLFFAGDGVVD